MDGEKEKGEPKIQEKVEVAIELSKISVEMKEKEKSQDNVDNEKNGDEMMMETTDNTDSNEDIGWRRGN